MFLSPHISKDKLSRLCISSIPLESLKDLNDFQSELNSPYSHRLSKTFEDNFNLKDFENLGDEEEEENYNILTTFQFLIITIILQATVLSFGLCFAENYAQLERQILEVQKLHLIVTLLILILIFHLLVINLSLLIEKINFKLIININFALLILAILICSFSLAIKDFFLIFLGVGVLASFLLFLIQLIILLNWVDFGCLSSWLGCTLSLSSLISYCILFLLNYIKLHLGLSWSLRILALVYGIFVICFNWNFNQKVDFILLQEGFKLNWDLILNLEFLIWFLVSFFSSILNSSISYILNTANNSKFTKLQNWILVILNLIGWCFGACLLGVFAGKLKLKNFSLIIILGISLEGLIIWFTQLNYTLILVYSFIFHFLFAGYLSTLLYGLNESLSLQIKAISMRGLILTTIMLMNLIPYLLILILTHNIKMTNTLNSYLILIASSSGLIVCLGALTVFYYLKKVKIQN